MVVEHFYPFHAYKVCVWYGYDFVRRLLLKYITMLTIFDVLEIFLVHP